MNPSTPPPTHSGGIYSVRQVLPNSLILFHGEKSTAVRAFLFADNEEEGTRLLMSTLCDALNEGPRLTAALEVAERALESAFDFHESLKDYCNPHVRDQIEVALNSIADAKRKGV